MKISFWGARGSIPVSGPEYLRYGGDTTCVEIRAASGDLVVIDCGSGVRRLGNRLVAEGARRFSLLFTHSHWDHILGFPFFKPVYDPKTRIDVFGCPFTESSIKNVIQKIMEPPQFPVNLGAIRADLRFNDPCRGDLRIGSLEISPIVLSHPNQGLGYRFRENGSTFVFLTDNELRHRHEGGRPYEEYLAFASGADVLVHDAEFTDEDYAKTEGWGHSTCRQAAGLALEAKVGRFGLFHHNQDRPDSEVDAMVEDCRRLAAEKSGRLDCFGVTQETVLEL